MKQDTLSPTTKFGSIEQLVRGVDAYLDATLEPEVQRITVVDGPAVLGPEPMGPESEQPGHIGMQAFIGAAVRSGLIRPVDAESLTHIIRGACLRAGILIAQSCRSTQARRRLGDTIRQLIEGLRT